MCVCVSVDVCVCALEAFAYINWNEKCTEIFNLQHTFVRWARGAATGYVCVCEPNM